MATILCSLAERNIPVGRWFYIILKKEIAEYFNKDCNTVCPQPVLVRQDATDTLEEFLWRRRYRHDTASWKPKRLDDVPFVNNARQQDDPHSRP
jgi:hypothetical protein